MTNELLMDAIVRTLKCSHFAISAWSDDDLYELAEEMIKFAPQSGLTLKRKRIK